LVDYRAEGKLISNASALIVGFIVESARRQTGIEAVDKEESRDDIVASENNEAFGTSGEAQLEQAIDQDVVVEARCRSIQSSDSRGA
jgi:hypothetical protein